MEKNRAPAGQQEGTTAECNLRSPPLSKEGRRTHRSLPADACPSFWTWQAWCLRRTCRSLRKVVQLKVGCAQIIRYDRSHAQVGGKSVSSCFVVFAETSTSGGSQNLFAPPRLQRKQLFSPLSSHSAHFSRPRRRDLLRMAPLPRPNLPRRRRRRRDTPSPLPGWLPRRPRAAFAR